MFFMVFDCVCDCNNIINYIFNLIRITREYNNCEEEEEERQVRDCIDYLTFKTLYELTKEETV